MSPFCYIAEGCRCVARYMEPALGRFTSVDPLAEKYYSWSPYVYVTNNPLKYIDPRGMDSIYEESLYNPKSHRGADTYKEILRISMRKGGGDVISATLAPVEVTPDGSYTRKGGNLYDFYGNIVGEAPLINRDGIIFDMLLGSRGIASMSRQASSNLSTNGYKEAYNYLKTQSMSKNMIKETLANFEKVTISLNIADKSTFGLRFYGGKASDQGRYLFPSFSNYSNRSGLALRPEWNTMTYLSQFQIKAGTP